MDIIAALIKYIEYKGLSQVDFAKKIEYDEGTLSRIVNRKTPITKPFRRKFRLSEGFPVEDLLEESKPHAGTAEEQKEYPAEYAGPERRGEDRRKEDRRIVDIKKRLLGGITAFDTTTTIGKECIRRIINFLETEVINYRKFKH